MHVQNKQSKTAVTSSFPALYSFDKRTSELARDMAIRGFLYDQDRAHEYIALLKAKEQEARLKLEQAVGRKLKSTSTGGVSTKDLEVAVFKDLHAPILFRSKRTKKPALDISALRGYIALPNEAWQNFALAEIERRSARKVRKTYIENVLRDIGIDGRIHSTFKIYGAITGRWSSAGPNLQNLPSVKHDPTVTFIDEIATGGIRSLYVAPAGYKIVNLDFSQLEWRIAAYASGDQNMINACLAGDIHRVNAELIWGEIFRSAPKEKQKKFRSLAKNFVFAICYGANSATVYANVRANGENATFEQIDRSLHSLKGKLATYYRWQDQRLRDAMITGATFTPLMQRMKWTGHEVNSIANEIMNFPIQGGAAEVVNMKFCEIDDQIKARKINAKPLGAVHDALVSEVHEDDVQKYLDLVTEVCENPVQFPETGLNGIFPIEVQVDERWS